jgi:hypothetical protein
MKLIKTMLAPPAALPRIRTRKPMVKILAILWISVVTVMLVVVISLLSHLLVLFKQIVAGL